MFHQHFVATELAELELEQDSASNSEGHVQSELVLFVYVYGAF